MFCSKALQLLAHIYCMCTSVYTCVHVQIPVKGLGTHQILFIHRALEIKFWNLQGLFSTLRHRKGHLWWPYVPGEAVSSVGLQAFRFFKSVSIPFSPEGPVSVTVLSDRLQYQFTCYYYTPRGAHLWSVWFMRVAVEWWWMDDFILTLCSTIFLEDVI